jgi:hypothetical protein
MIHYTICTHLGYLRVPELSAEHADVCRLPRTMGIKGLTALISEHAPKAIRVGSPIPLAFGPLLNSLTRRDP